VRFVRIKALASLIIIGFIVVFAYHFIALGAVDAPHNEANSISCGSCHGQGLLQSFWGGSGLYSTVDELCLSCHTASSGPYTATSAPLVKTHSSDNTSEQYGVWSWECRNCHDPHYQKQKNYKNTDANELYLATGIIDSFVYNEGDNESILHYVTISYKSGWNATKLTEKTTTHRRTVLFPNLGKLGYSYPVIEIDEGEITVTGNVTPVYQYITSSTFAMIYGQYVKDSISNNQVKLFNRKDAYSCADGDTTYNGVCEICHTQTLYHRNNGSGNPHYPAVRCNICHFHMNGFADSDHTGGFGSDCDDCHGHDDGWAGGSYFGTTGSHSTHTENDSDDAKGPFIDCDTCHDIYNYPYFKSGTDGNADGKYDLTETDVCDICHSPDGSYDGVNDTSIGAKNNWSDGVYESPTLKTGKEKWCAGCHDEEPANSKADDTGIDAPNVDTTTITNTEIYQNNEDGVYMDNSQSHVITNSDIYQNGHDGLHAEAVSYIDITACNFYDNINDGIYLVNSHDQNILGCQIYDNGDDGLDAPNVDTTAIHESLRNMEKP